LAASEKGPQELKCTRARFRYTQSPPRARSAHPAHGESQCGAIIQPTGAADHRPQQPRPDALILRQLVEPQAQQPTLTIAAGTRLHFSSGSAALVIWIRTTLVPPLA
jgi:hypothetical protein